MALDKRTRQKLEAELAVLLKKGRLQRASLVLRAILERDPDDDRLFVKLAEVSQKLGDAEGVRAAYRGAAAAAERKGFYLRAMAALRQLARHLPPEERPWSELSKLALRLGLVGDALGFLDEGARAWAAQGNQPAVLAALRRAHDLAPDDAHRLARLALELRRAGEEREAIDLLRREAARHRAAGRRDAWLALAGDLSALVPDELDLACQVAGALLERGEARGALLRLQRHAGESRSVEVLQLLARAFQALGQEARRWSAVRELARALGARGRAAAARPHWEALLAAHPDDAEARQALGIPAAPARQVDPTARPRPALAQATTPAPGSAPRPAPVLARQAAAPEAEDEVIDLGAEGIEVHDEAATQADLEDDLAHLDFLVAHRFHEEAGAMVAALEASHPGHPGVAALRARLAAGPERVAAHPVAAPATTLPPPELLAAPAAAGAAPAEPIDLLLLGAVELPPVDDLLASIREQVALQVSPDDAETHYDLGIACREMGLIGEAQAEFERAFASATGPRAVDCLVGIALCQAAHGEPVRASRTLKRALAHPALTPVGAAAVLYELGALREQAGDLPGAASAFRAAERSQQGFRDAAARAERLHPRGPAGRDAGGAPDGLDLVPSGA